jgi:predicted nucleotidyltransferase
MISRKDILIRIKKSIISVVPNAVVILYGSYARDEEKVDSDIDVLILIDKDKVTWKDEKTIAYPLYDIEFDIGKIISPLILSKNDWEKRHRRTPFYENVLNEGVTI